MGREQGKSRAVFLAIAAIGFFAAINLICDAAVAVMVRTDLCGLIRRAAKVARDARAIHHLGRISHYKEGQAAVAEGYYRTALARDPLFSPAWYDLAVAYSMSGNSPKAERAIENYARLNHSNTERLWNIAGFYLAQMGDERKAAGYIIRCASLEPASSGRAFDVLAAMNLPVGWLAENLSREGPEICADFELHLLAKGRLRDALALWEVGEGCRGKARLRLCDALIKEGKFDKALIVWSHGAAGTPDSNGGFERDTENACFDWRLTHDEGVDITFDRTVRMEGERSLRVSFDGRHNALLVVRRVVPVGPGKYVLNAFLKTEGLTTSNGVFLEARGAAGCRLYKRSEVLTGTNTWRDISVPLAVPSGCDAVEIALIREKSNKFDNRIGGTAWMDGVSLIRK